MDSIDNRERLVFNVRRRSSSVSQALRAIPESRANLRVQETRRHPQSNPTVEIANDRVSREQAYRLAYRVYQRSGLTDLGPGKWCVSPFDTHPQTLTLLAQDQSNVPLATVSTVYDSSKGLPCDEVYHQEINALRKKGYTLAEVTRLAIDSNPAQARVLLLELFNNMYLFTRHVRGCRHLVVEVHPRHVGYYRRLLMFEAVGPQRSCPRVKGAPAILMALDLEKIEQAVRAARPNVPSRTQARYPYSYSPSDERRLARALLQQHQPMTPQEALYFGLKDFHPAFQENPYVHARG